MSDSKNIPEIGDELWANSREEGFQKYLIMEIVDIADSPILVANNENYSISVKASDMMWVIDAWYEDKTL